MAELTDDQLENELQRQFENGQSVGLRKAGDYVMGLAKEAFEQSGPIHPAVYLREIANTLYHKASSTEPPASKK